MRKLVAILLAVILWASILAPQRITQPSQETEVSSLIDESHTLSLNKDFGEIERIWYLGDLLSICVTIAPEKVQNLSDELFTASRTSQILRKSGRIANEKNAFVFLSRIDPERAMRRFPEVEDPDQVRASEDFRAHAARTIFTRFFELKGRDALPEIRRQAKHIGETGEYPYHALGLVLSELTASQGDDARSTANEIFDEILPYYGRISLISNKDSEFLELLQDARFAIDTERLKRGIEAFTAHLKQELDEEKSATNRRDTFTAKLFKDEKSFLILKSKSLELLFRAFPFIAETYPDLADQLATSYPVLKQAQGNFQVASTIVDSSLPRNESINLEIRGLQESLLAKIEDLQQTNPKLAMRLAETLPKHSVIRMAAISSAMSGLSQADAQQAKDTYTREFTDPSLIVDDRGNAKVLNQEDRVKAMAAYVKATYYAQDFDNFNYFTAQAFEKAAILYEQSYGNRPFADGRPGYAELVQVVEFGMAHNVSWLLDQIKQQPQVLKAHLLMYAAKGAFERAPA